MPTLDLSSGAALLIEHNRSESNQTVHFSLGQVGQSVGARCETNEEMRYERFKRQDWSRIVANASGVFKFRNPTKQIGKGNCDFRQQWPLATRSTGIPGLPPRTPSPEPRSKNAPKETWQKSDVATSVPMTTPDAQLGSSRSVW